MKPIQKDELYDHVSGFLKGKGIELKEGSYAKGIQKGCTLLADAINLSQEGLSRAKVEVDKKLEQMRQVIHEKTAPRPKPGAQTPKSAGETPKAQAQKPKAKATKRTSAKGQARGARYGGRPGCRRGWHLAARKRAHIQGAGPVALLSADVARRADTCARSSP